ncbi:Putative calmodulin-like protein [Seminavis robusta]|uniref:Calmodulin n=1 Tax=Seminavis robusta TaxID=568900 RepID=A0A9N8EML1_9STRA|nr:Putative calmodulin-like protein [Seminavis robusta]|eukprot:Sro1478_g276060.1 Putative calmodulin-like protein (153) ;mRNA; f:23488-24278
MDEDPIAGMSQEEIDEYKEAFGMFDINGDGTIELTELKQVMLQLGQNPAEEDLIEMMRLVDVNGDNEIDFDEFLVMMTMRSGERDTEAELREAFKLFDLDGSGTISREELKTLMKNLGQALTDEEIDAMIDEVDINLDGEISFDEFQALMLS